MIVGRGVDVDSSFPEDLEMSSRHFAIEGRPDGGLLTDLDSTNGTFINGERIHESLVSCGDEIFAGQTTFSVVDAAEAPVPPPSTEEPRESQFSFETPSSLVCEGMFLSDEALPLIAEEQTVAQLIDELKKQKLYIDALRVLCRAMGTNAALLWSCDCVKEMQRDELSKLEVQVLDAAVTWAANPSQETAIAAYWEASLLGHEGPVAMLARAAYWGNGNAAPPDEPEMPADKQIPSQAIAGALTLVAVDGPPKDAARKYEKFISRAFATTTS